MIKRIVQFFSDVKSEFNKVTWPTREETQNKTVIVVFLSIVMAVFLGVVDLGFSEVIKLVIG